MEQKKIEKCPYCNSNTGIIVRPVSGNVKRFEGLPYQVMCDTCHCRGPEKDTKEEAVEMWNEIVEYAENWIEELESVENWCMAMEIDAMSKGEL